ncbi:hypothetical protein F4561_004212 [Lipingzhangella halophila]|uniref:CDP-Glycerol:Poly(Glycerophosphate) glycerophosphotransferase n=1 Tax=Lipingzhangella halophila TaxID=1783352 RepID=A0A7W7RJZ8_9ACTN|nr:hypothetical protein [Lipingzhangella halophila]MBB4933392.1 hypothetical protein [Lipingzhangella halophila]
MSDIPWTPGPYGLNAHSRATHTPERTVLVVVHHLTAGTRLADVVPLIEHDNRIQVLYTAAPGSPFTQSGEEYIRGLGGVVIPWQAAITNSFDLAIAANPGHQMAQLHAPILTLEHGVGPGKLVARADGYGPRAPRYVTGLVAGGLITNGRVIPTALGAPNERHRDALADLAPELEQVTRVVGDPTYDRLLASLPDRAEYRRALGVDDDRSLVVVSSTWGPHSLLGRDLTLPAALTEALPSKNYRTVTIPHPLMWLWHGRRQVRAWLAQAQRQGADLLPPEEGWRAALVAADAVIGDHGSVTMYAAALGRPTLLATFPHDEVHPGSAIELLGRATPTLDRGSALEPQVHAAIDNHVPERGDWYAPLVSSVPGEAASRLREVMYELMRLPEPDTPPRTEPVPLPRVLPRLEGEPR